MSLGNFIAGKCARLRCLALVAVMLTSCAVLTTSADASCGHYVKRLGPGFVPGKTAGQRPDLAKLGIAAQPVQATPPLQVPCGCRGAECGSSPLVPVPASPFSPERLRPQPELTTFAAAREMHACRPCSWLAMQAAASPSSGYPLLLNRPPIASV